MSGFKKPLFIFTVCCFFFSFPYLSIQSQSDLYFKDAINLILKHEGGYANNPHDKGGATKYGISLRYLQSLGSRGDLNNDNVVDVDDIKILDVNKAISLYKSGFWDKYGYNRINNAVLAERILDISINMGPKTAHKLVQKAVNLGRITNTIKQDGILGAKTINAINGSDTNRLLLRINALAISRYLDIVEKDPTQKVFIDGWLKRASNGL